MRLLLTILLALIILNLLGGYAIPAYSSWGYYHVSWGGIVVLVLILYFLGVGRDAGRPML